MGLLSNRVTRESLKPGDHIYSWKTAYIYAHHGIYVGEDKVIHFTRGRGQEVRTGTTLDRLLVSSVPNCPQIPCTNCRHLEEGNGVVSSCLDCFLWGGVLYRFEYDVNPALFLAKARGGTCTLAVSDPDEIVVHRASYLLTDGFGCYNVYKNNCEDFAIYCKTGWLVDQVTLGQSGQAASIIDRPLAAVRSVVDQMTLGQSGQAASIIGRSLSAVRSVVDQVTLGQSGQAASIIDRPLAAVRSVVDQVTLGQSAIIGRSLSAVLSVVDQVTLGQSGQAASIIGGPLAVVLSIPLHLLKTNIYGRAATTVTAYCIGRYASDIGRRKNVIKVEVEDLATFRLQFAETIAAVPALTAR